MLRIALASARFFELVGELADGEGAGLLEVVEDVEPEGLVLAPVEQPGAEGGLLPLLPGVGGPAPLALGALDEGDVAAGGDGVDAGLDDVPVPVGPAGGDLGDGGGAVAVEPGGLDLPGGLLACEHDLERPLPEVHLGNGGGCGGGGGEAGFLSVGEQPVGVVDLPVQLLLEGDHALAGAGPGVADGVEAVAGGRFVGGADCGGLVGGELVGEGVEGAAERERKLGGEREFLKLGASELVTLFPLLILVTTTEAAAPLSLTDLLEPEARRGRVEHP